MGRGVIVIAIIAVNGPTAALFLERTPQEFLRSVSVPVGSRPASRWLHHSDRPQAPLLHPVREPCGRRGRYAVARLIAERGDAKLTDLLPALNQLFEGDEFREHLRSLQGEVRGDYSAPPFPFPARRMMTSL